MSTLPAILLAVAVGAVFGWWSYRDRLEQPLARVAMAGRLIGIATLLLLLLNPAIVSSLLASRPLVLLDRSLSMQSAGAQSDSATTFAVTLGDTVAFGELAPGMPGGGSRIAEPLATALASGRPVTIVTDGEISDGDAIAPALLSAATVVVLPRRTEHDVALTEVRGTERVSVGDTIRLMVDVRRIGIGADSALIEVRDGVLVVARGVAQFGPTGFGRVAVTGRIPGAVTGVRWLTVRRVGEPDSEPDDDLRWWPIRVTATPGIVVVAVTADWDARFLYRALRDVTESPVRGYVQLLPGQWRRMDDLRPVSAAEVRQAAQRADLLAVRGASDGWRQSGRARLLWPPATLAGDWYLRPAAASPLTNGFAVAERDSLPPATSILPLDVEATRSWVGATAQLARRGSEVPVVGGREDVAGRTITIGADGLYRWAFRGGASEQLWRTLIADAAAWLLATPDSGAVAVRPVTLVTQRGRPVRFRWVGTGPAASVAITLTDSGRTRVDTLRFDGNGDADLALEVGRYQYALSGGGVGEVGVEPYADELVPGPITLEARSAARAPTRTSHGTREWPLLFALALTAFAAEWLVRRRLSLR